MNQPLTQSNAVKYQNNHSYQLKKSNETHVSIINYLIGDTPTNLITNKWRPAYLLYNLQNGDSPGLLIGDTLALLSGDTPTLLINYQGGTPALLGGDTPTN